MITKNLKITIPLAPTDDYLENFSFEEIWQLGFKEGCIAYELAVKRFIAEGKLSNA